MSGLPFIGAFPFTKLTFVHYYFNPKALQYFREQLLNRYVMYFIVPFLSKQNYCGMLKVSNITQLRPPWTI